MKSIVEAFDGLPWLVKLILALPLIDGIAYGIYRIAKGIDERNLAILIAGIIWIFFGWAFLWIIDLVCVIFYRRVKVFA